VTATISRIRQERIKLADKPLAEVVPEDIARKKQVQLSLRLAEAQAELARVDQVASGQRVDIDQIFNLAERCADSYVESPDRLRREWNLARYEVFNIDVEGGLPVVRSAALTPIFEGLATAEVTSARKDRNTPDAEVQCLLSPRWSED
jgi:hypothetical protein